MLVDPEVELRHLGSFAELESLPEHDLVLSCEVVQRLPAADRMDHVRALRRVAPRGIVFVPNSENRSHLAISGLAGRDRNGRRRRND